MELKELRLGNIVFDDYSGNMIVTAINTTNRIDSTIKTVHLAKNEHMLSGAYDVSKIKPIKLTEDWINKFGLTLTDWFCDESFLIVKDEDYGWCFRVRNASHTREIEFSYFKYVHQFQNAYYALTGDEVSVEF